MNGDGTSNKIPSTTHREQGNHHLSVHLRVCWTSTCSFPSFKIRSTPTLSPINSFDYRNDFKNSVTFRKVSNLHCWNTSKTLKHAELLNVYVQVISYLFIDFFFFLSSTVSTNISIYVSTIIIIRSIVVTSFIGSLLVLHIY